MRVDPGWGAFELGPDADRCLVDDEMGGEVGAGQGMGPFGAELLVDEGGGVAELVEDLGHRVAVADEGFGLDAGLVAGVVGVFGHALVGENAETAVPAEAKDLAAGAEVACGGVVEGVVLEGARGLEVEAEGGEAGLEIGGVGHGELDFDLGALHGESICVRGLRMRRRICTNERGVEDKAAACGGAGGGCGGWADPCGGGDGGVPDRDGLWAGSGCVGRGGGGEDLCCEAAAELGSADCACGRRGDAGEGGRCFGRDGVAGEVVDGELLAGAADVAAAADGGCAGRCDGGACEGGGADAAARGCEGADPAGGDADCGAKREHVWADQSDEAAHVLEDLDGRIDAVLDGGPTTVGVESTVLDVCEWPMVIYRPGAVTAEMIAAVAGEVRLAGPVMREAAPESLPSPGVGLRHYAPRARLVLVRQNVEGRESVREAVGREAGLRVGVMLPEGWDGAGAVVLYRWGAWGDAEVLARRLFDGLRTLDEAGVEVIVCPLPSGGGLGDALQDRLEKAARKR